jgi:glutamate 5-kinase
MITKILAAKRAAGSGASTVIAWGREPDVLLRLTQGEAIGTLLVATTAKQAAQAVDGRPPATARGRGDRRRRVTKLRDEGKSLLPIGMVRC